MTSASDSGEASPLPARVIGAAAWATRGFFLLAGICTATWAAMVPLAKARLGLDEAQLGIVLLCMGVGSVAAMPLAGLLSHRHGSRAVMVLSGGLTCLAMPTLAVAPSAVVMGATLVGFGGAIGILDVSMNAHAAEVERRDGRPLMSGFHGAFSVGGLVGAVAMSGLLGAGVALGVCVAAVAALLLATIAALRGALLSHADPGTPLRALMTRPPAAALLLGALCLVVFLTEGAMLDWVGVFLRSHREFSAAGAGLGYAAFSIAMATGRLLGDRITARLGPQQVVRLGSLVAACGLVVAMALPGPAAALAGFVLVGLGASNIVPVLFSAAGRLPGTSVGMALATVTALGYAGMLAGPAVIGFVAAASSLPIALGGIAVLLLAVASCATVVARR